MSSSGEPPNASRSPSSARISQTEEPELIRLCRTRQWNSAIVRVLQNPSEAFVSFFPHGTAFATACRYSAPTQVIASLVDTIKSHMQEYPEMRSCNPLRINAGGRGTPLHEAVSNEELDLNCLRILIHADDVNLNDNNDGSNPHEGAGGLTSAAGEIFPPPAIRAQDVDGQIPLHLMIRRVFRSCPRPAPSTGANMESTSVETGDADRASATSNGIESTNSPDNYDSTLLSILSELIEAYPQGCMIPDHREYEETPLVLALKASLYAQYRISPYNSRHDPPLDSNRLWNNMLEHRIYTVVKMILTAYPLAANHVAATSGYTMLHSALFHGRCARTVSILMDAARRVQTQSDERVAREHITNIARGQRLNPGSAMTMMNTTLSLPNLIVQPNIPQGEVPLHIATMRGDVLETIRLLVNQGPRAVYACDLQGRTPMLWLWIRYCSTKYSTREEVQFMRWDHIQIESREYSCEEVEHSVSFLHMRYVPEDYISREVWKWNMVVWFLRPWLAKLPRDDASTGLESLFSSLNKLQGGDAPRCSSRGSGEAHDDDDDPDDCELITYRQQVCASPEEAGALLLWEKALHMLRACSACTSSPAVPQKTTVLHVAASHPCVPSSFVHIALSLYPQFVKSRDHLGRLPLHCAASRTVYKWKPFPLVAAASLQTQGGIGWRPRKLKIISERTVATILDACPEAVRVYDNSNRLPLHYAIEAVGRTTSVHKAEVSYHDYLTEDDDMDLWNAFLEPLLKAWPDSVDRRDGVTKLYPFMQAAAKIEGVIERTNKNESDSDRSLQERTDVRQLTMIYGILRLNPEIVRSGISEEGDAEEMHRCSEENVDKYDSSSDAYRTIAGKKRLRAD